VSGVSELEHGGSMEDGEGNAEKKESRYSGAVSKTSQVLEHSVRSQEGGFEETVTKPDQGTGETKMGKTTSFTAISQADKTQEGGGLNNGGGEDSSLCECEFAELGA